MVRWTRCRGRAGWLIAGVVVVLGGCTAEPLERVDTPLVYGSTTASTASTIPDPLTPEESEAIVVDAYRHSWATVLAAYANSSVVGLHRVTSGPVLWGISDDILYGVSYSLVLDGTMTHHPRVQTLEAVRATLVDCMLVEDEVRDTLTGDVLGEGAQWIELEVEMLLENLTWKINDFRWLADDCVPPAPQI